MVTTMKYTALIFCCFVVIVVMPWSALLVGGVWLVVLPCWGEVGAAQQCTHHTKFANPDDVVGPL